MPLSLANPGPERRMDPYRVSSRLCTRVCAWLRPATLLVLNEMGERFADGQLQGLSRDVVRVVGGAPTPCWVDRYARVCDVDSAG